MDYIIRKDLLNYSNAFAKLKHACFSWCNVQDVVLDLPVAEVVVLRNCEGSITVPNLPECTLLRIANTRAPFTITFEGLPKCANLQISNCSAEIYFPDLYRCRKLYLTTSENVHFKYLKAKFVAKLVHHKLSNTPYTILGK